MNKSLFSFLLIFTLALPFFQATAGGHAPHVDSKTPVEISYVDESQPILGIFARTYETEHGTVKEILRLQLREDENVLAVDKRVRLEGELRTVIIYPYQQKYLAYWTPMFRDEIFVNPGLMNLNGTFRWQFPRLGNRGSKVKLERFEPGGVIQSTHHEWPERGTEYQTMTFTLNSAGDLVVEVARTLTVNGKIESADEAEFVYDRLPAKGGFVPSPIRYRKSRH